jgi:hypothetical protein
MLLENKNFLSVTVLGLSVLQGCGLADSMKNMETNTTEMNATTKTMTSEIETMSGGLNETNKVMKDEMAPTMREMKEEMITLKGAMNEMRKDINGRLGDTMDRMDGRMEKMTGKLEETNKVMKDEMAPTMREMNVGLQATQKVMDEKLATLMKQMSDALTKEMVPAIIGLKGQMSEMQKTIKDELTETNKNMKLLTVSIDEKMMKKMDAMSGSVDRLANLMEHQMLGLLKDMNDNISKSMIKSIDEMVVSVKALGGDMTAVREKMASMDGKMGALPQMLTHLEAMQKTLGGFDRLIPDLKQAITVTVRAGSMERILAKETLLGKFKEASVWLFSFDYQAWQEGDTRTLNDLKKLAIDEFTREIRNFLQDENALHVDPMIMDPRHKSLQAISAVLQEISPSQKDRIKACQKLKAKDPRNSCLDQTISMLDLIEEALRHRKEDPETISEPWIKEALLHQKFLIYILQLRYNLTGAIALGNLHNRPERHMKTLDFFEWQAESTEALKIFAGATWSSFNLWRKEVFSLDPVSDPLAHLSDRELLFVEEAFQYATRTREFLRSIDVMPVVDDKIETLVQVTKVANLGNVTGVSRDRKLKMQRVYQSLETFGSNLGESSWGFVGDEFGIR